MIYNTVFRKIMQSPVALIQKGTAARIVPAAVRVSSLSSLFSLFILQCSHRSVGAKRPAGSEWPSLRDPGEYFHG